MAYLRSPIFYMGNKYKLLDFILPLFPNKCNVFYDLFGGSAVVSLNYKNKCNKVIYNDFNQNIVGLVKMLLENDPIELNDYFEKKKEEYGLRTFSVKDKGPDKYNTYKEMEKGFLQLRKDYNESVERESIKICIC